MKDFCFLGDREYGIIYFKNFTESLDEILDEAKYKDKILLHFGQLKITTQILSYMLKLLRLSYKNNFEIIYIIENKESIEDRTLIESKKYFKIFSSIEEYNKVKVYAGFEVKIYDDNVYVRNLIKEELIKTGFSIKERNSFNFLNKVHDSKYNSIYILDFTSYKDEKIEEIKKIKEKNSDATVVLIVFENDFDEALKTIKFGVDRVIKRPFDLNEFVSIIKYLASSADLKRENKRLLEEILTREKQIRVLYNKVEDELKLAGDIQKTLMPAKVNIFNNYKVEYLFLPSMDIGGDFCDFIKLDEDRFAVVFADISGHGVAAALLSSMLKVLINNNISRFNKVSELIENVNEEIINIFPKGKFVSMFYLVIDTKLNKMTFSKASQESGLMVTDDGIVDLETDGQILGLFSKKIFPALKFYEKTIDFNKNDKLLLYTDGIVEELNNNEESYGLERLKLLISNSNLEEILEDLKKFVGRSNFNDDVTLLKIERIY